MVYRSARGRTAALDFRETAPGRLPAAHVPGPGPAPRLHRAPHRGRAGHSCGHARGAAALRHDQPRCGGRGRPSGWPADGFRVLPRWRGDGREREPAQALPGRRAPVPRGRPNPYPRARCCVSRTWPARWTRSRASGLAAFYRGRIARRIAATWAHAAQAGPGDRGLMTCRDLAELPGKVARPAVRQLPRTPGRGHAAADLRRHRGDRDAQHARGLRPARAGPVIGRRPAPRSPRRRRSPSPTAASTWPTQTSCACPRGALTGKGYAARRRARDRPHGRARPTTGLRAVPGLRAARSRGEGSTTRTSR